MSFSSFSRRLVQTVHLHNFEADPHYSAVLIMSRDKLIATMTTRWSQHTRNQALLQPNLNRFADWIDSYAEACDIFQQQIQKTKVNNFSRCGPTDISCQVCSRNHNIVRCPKHLEKSMYDQQDSVKKFNLCPNCLRAQEKEFCQSKAMRLLARCNVFNYSTLHRINSFGTGTKSHKNSIFRKHYNQNCSN